MNLISNTAPTMTSREIADLVESRHDKVKQSIDRLVVRGAIAQPIMVGYQISGSPIGGAAGQEYLVGKRDSYIVVAQLSPEFTARLVDRWQELEAAQLDPLAGLPPEQRALIALMVDNAAIKAKQAEQDTTIAIQSDAIRRIEANQVAAIASVQSFTALGYSIFKEIPMSKIELTRLGRKAAAISKKKGITVDHVSDSRFGRVGSYHVSVLDAALEEMTK